MFQIGQMVAYGATGICTIEDIRQEALSRAGTQKQEYYILRPLATPTCITYVPTANETLTARMRCIMTKEQIDAMIDSVRGQNMEWIEDTRRRTEAWQKILSGGISGELLLLVACLYLERKKKSGEGKKFCATDEKILTSAERMIGEEFSVALKIPEKEVPAYIAQRLEK